MAASRVYLRFTNLTGSNYVRTEKSAVLPVGTSFDDSGGGIGDLSFTKGTASANGSCVTAAQTAHQDRFEGKFVSPPLKVQTIDANTWTLGMAFSSTDLQANAFLVTSIYVLTTADTVRGYVYDSDTALGTEWPVTATGQIITLSGAQVTDIAPGDRLCFELWAHAAQDVATAFTLRFFAEGTVDVFDGQTSNPASFIETPQDIFSLRVDDFSQFPKAKLARSPI